MIAATQAPDIILKAKRQPKNSLQKREKTVMRLVDTPESKRAHAVEMKNFFLREKYDISEEMISKFFGSCNGSHLLSHYLILEMQNNHNHLSHFDEHDTDDEMLQKAKDWRNQFFDLVFHLGLPPDGDYIHRFYEQMHTAFCGTVRYFQPMYRLLMHYLEKEVSEGMKYGRLDKTEYHYVVG